LEPENTEYWGHVMRQIVPMQTKLSEHLALQEMVGHRYLSEDELVQESAWSDGTRICVNFSDTAFDNGQVSLPAKGFLVAGPVALGTWRGSIREKISVEAS